MSFPNLHRMLRRLIRFRGHLQRRLSPRISDYESSSRLKEPVEKKLTFYLTNVGPGTIRNAQVNWVVSGEPIHEQIVKSGIFKGVVREIEQNRIVLDNGNAATIVDYSMTGKTEISLLEETNTVRITMPDIAANALAISSLIQARTIRDRSRQMRTPKGAWEVLDHINRKLSEPMSTIDVRIEFVRESVGRSVEEFVIMGILTPVPAYPILEDRPAGRVAMIPEDGSGVWLSRINIKRK